MSLEGEIMYCIPSCSIHWNDTRKRSQCRAIKNDALVGIYTVEAPPTLMKKNNGDEAHSAEGRVNSVEGAETPTSPKTDISPVFQAGSLAHTPDEIYTKL